MSKPTWIVIFCDSEFYEEKRVGCGNAEFLDIGGMHPAARMSRYLSINQRGIVRSTSAMSVVSCVSRVGRIGDWMNYFTPEIEKEADEMFVEPLKSRGLTFTYSKMP